jgi:hypothetical protein
MVAVHNARPLGAWYRADPNPQASAIRSHFEVEQFPAAVSARSENNHKKLATAANPFAFTKQGNVSTPELDFARNRKQLRQPPPEGEFYANFIGMS